MKGLLLKDFCILKKADKTDGRLCHFLCDLGCCRKNAHNDGNNGDPF